MSLLSPPTQEDYYRKTSKEKGFAANKLSQIKNNKYKTILENHNFKFILLVIETFGYIEKAGRTLIKHMIKQYSKNK